MENFTILSLGSNLGDRVFNLKACFKAMEPFFQVGKISQLYESDALLLPDSPPEWNLNFFNLCVSGKTSLEPLELLKALKAVEEQISGAKRDTVWGPRKVDIDIVAYNNNTFTSPTLSIPHARMLERTFVLWPLAEIHPDWLYPVQGEHYNKTALELAQKFGVNFPNDLGHKPTPLNTKIFGKL